jgi:hypothetical protein
MKFAGYCNGWQPYLQPEKQRGHPQAPTVKTLAKSYCSGAELALAAELVF